MDDDAPRLPQPFASANHADNVGHLIASVKEQIGNPPALIAMCGRLFQNIADSPATRLYPTVVPAIAHAARRVDKPLRGMSVNVLIGIGILRGHTAASDLRARHRSVLVHRARTRKYYTNFSAI
jgi:hypothetical protein